MQRVLAAALLILAAAASACAKRGPVVAPDGRRVLETREGLASYYGKEFHGRITASGVRFDMNALVAAHPIYPFGTRLRITNLVNRRTTTVRVIDRGPAAGMQADGVIVDVSRRAADVLGFVQQGRVRVRLEVLSWDNR